MINLIKKRFEESISVKKEILNDPEIMKAIQTISLDVIECLKSGQKVIFAGNGGSFSDSFHLAGEFVSRFLFDRAPLPALALGGNNSIITAIGNDYAFEDIFSREIQSLGAEGDVFIAISTSGNSGNILKAIKTAKEIGIKTYGLTGNNKGTITSICSCICVPSAVTARIQEAHILIGHIICEIVEMNIFKSNLKN